MPPRTWTPAEFDAYLADQRRHYLALERRFRCRSRPVHWLNAIAALAILGTLGTVSLWALVVLFQYATQ